MSKTASIRARMDPQLKDEVETILRELGMSASQALTLFYQQIRLRRGIPFDLHLPQETQEDEIEVENGAAPASTMLPQLPAVPFPVDHNRSVMERNIEAYRRLHRELVEKYLGQHVAIYDGQLVDHDSDPVILLTRIRNDFLNQVVLRRKVEPTPERELRIRHPQFERAA